MRVWMLAGLFAIGAVACSKGHEQGPPEPSGTMPPATMPKATASAVGSAAVGGTSATVATAASVAAAATAGAASSVAGAKKDAGAGAAGKTVTAKVEGKNFALDLASPVCRAGAECAMSIRITAGGGFHINKEYPYKFAASPAGGLAYLGKSDANTFSKANGDFAQDGEKTGTMTVRFKPSSAGEASVAGTYKLSVCSEDQCQIEAQAVALSVPVL